MLVEVAPEKAVIWTKPEDMSYEPKEPLARLGKLDGEFLAIFADSGVRAIKTNTDLDTLWSMFTYAGQEKIQKKNE